MTTHEFAEELERLSVFDERSGRWLFRRWPVFVCWDLYPLAPDAWDMAVTTYDGSSDDNRTVTVRAWIRDNSIDYGAASLPVPKGWRDGGTRKMYMTRPDDLDRVTRLGVGFSVNGSPLSPNWLAVQDRLIQAGHRAADLVATPAPTLLKMPDLAEKKPKRKGRRPDRVTLELGEQVQKMRARGAQWQQIAKALRKSVATCRNAERQYSQKRSL